ncbi:MAG: hypothetical protein ACYS47_19680, partial [Planctomycetota bacterium]
RGRERGLRTILGVCALAAGFLIAISLLLILGGEGDRSSATSTHDALADYRLSPESTVGRETTPPSSPEEGTTVETPSAPRTPGADPKKPAEPAEEPSVPGPDPGPEEVEKPLPPRDPREKTPREEKTPAETPPSEVKIPKPEGPRSLPSRAWEVEMQGALQVRPGGNAPWSEARSGKPVYSGSSIRTGSCGPGLVRFRNVGEVLLREGTSVGIEQPQKGLVRSK